MTKMVTFGCPIFKHGSGIHIKEKNKGKFTASAKAADSLYRNMLNLY